MESIGKKREKSQKQDAEREPSPGAVDFIAKLKARQEELQQRNAELLRKQHEDQLREAIARFEKAA